MITQYSFNLRLVVLNYEVINYSYPMGHKNGVKLCL